MKDSAQFPGKFVTLIMWIKHCCHYCKIGANQIRHSESYSIFFSQ